ncbi:IS3 family transposase [Ancylobacter sp.]|uniref:IS3 family transposase n=1 Tax=Ancylobacter sp. TaxID=1872567 RepID=UPI003C7AE14E
MFMSLRSTWPSGVSRFAARIGRGGSVHPSRWQASVSIAAKIEPLCKVLSITPSTYHAHVARRLDPSKCSAPAPRDEVLRPETESVFAENFEVYGARKVWRQMMREGVDDARCTVERLMQGMVLAGSWTAYDRLCVDDHG